jgi:hypothetical protein
VKTSQRVLAAIALLPVVAGVAAAPDFAHGPASTTFHDAFLDALFIVMLFGTVPAVLSSLVHTQLTRNRSLADRRFPRVLSGLYGGVIGVVAGSCLAGLLMLRTLAPAPVLLLAGVVWGALGGIVYGLLVGPARRLTSA